VWPEHLVEVADDEAIIRCRLDLVEQLGEYAIVHMNTDDSNAITAKFKRPPSALRGEMIALGFDASNVHLFDAKTGARI
jgi:ABC-type sugar transport system ATPase subunit